MRINLPLTQQHHGHNLHECRHLVFHDDADVARRCVVHVSNRHTADSSGSCSPGIRHLGGPARSSRLSRSAAGVKIGTGIAGALFGVLFAFQAHAALLYDNTAAGTTCTGCTVVSYAPNQTSCYEDNHLLVTFSPTVSFRVEKIEMAMFSGEAVSLYIDVENHLGQWKTLQVGPMDQNYATYESGTSTAPQVILYANQLAELSYSVFPGYTTTSDANTHFGQELGIISDTTVYQIDNCNTNTLSEVYGSPKMKIWGTLLDEESTNAPGTEVPLPTSTYDGTYASSIPMISWSSSSNVLTTSTFFGTKINNMMGNATNTFPLCLVPPWFRLIDILAGATATNTAQTLIIQSAGIVPTSTISLQQFPTVLAMTGANNALTTLIAFGKMLAWSLFGLYVFTDIFKPKNNETL